MPTSRSLRILVVDDEESILNAYDELFSGSVPTESTAAMNALKGRLFNKAAQAPVQEEWSFVLQHGRDAVEAVDIVEAALSQNNRFAVAILDMRMPPGPHGAWAAVRIRAMDPHIHIIIATAFSDVDPDKLAELAPPREKLFYVPKPFHPDEIRKLTLSCGQTWAQEIAAAHA